MYKMIGIGLFLLVSSLKSKEMLKQVMRSYREEIVDEKRFVHNLEVMNGQQREVWMMEGRALSPHEYEQAYTAAERAERLREEQEGRKARAAALSRLLGKHELELKELGDLYDTYRLQPYMVWSEATVPSREVYMRIDEYRKKAQDLIEQGAACPQLSEEQLQEMVVLEQQLTFWAKRVRSCMRATLTRALEVCDDTALLKKLLMVSL